jgi:hypothetical protein
VLLPVAEPEEPPLLFFISWPGGVPPCPGLVSLAVPGLRPGADPDAPGFCPVVPDVDPLPLCWVVEPDDPEVPLFMVPDLLEVPVPLAPVLPLPVPPACANAATDRPTASEAPNANADIRLYIPHPFCFYPRGRQRH